MTDKNSQDQFSQLNQTYSNNTDTVVQDTRPDVEGSANSAMYRFYENGKQPLQATASTPKVQFTSSLYRD